jgi:resuscitation-promoting factor RpfA
VTPRPVAPPPAAPSPVSVPTELPRRSPSTRESAPAARPAPTVADATPAPSAAPAPAAPPPASVATTYTVSAGDSLWSIAADHVAGTSGRAPAQVPDAEVTGFWQRICDANQGRLRSGDLNLIFPGEQVVLPAVQG